MVSRLLKSINILVLIAFLSGSLFLNTLLTRAQPDAISLLVDPTTFLPLIHRNIGTPIFGAETWSLSSSKSMPMADNADIHWLRNFAIPWDLIEASPGIYNWSYVDEAGLLNATARGMTVIAIVKYTPSWAQKVPPYACGAIKQDALDEFAVFLQQVVRRYSNYPYNLKYIELGNEPDVAPELVGTNYRSDFGCWGDPYDQYYGGGYYAEMLKTVYPAIKAINPMVQVLIGGLLLAHDPTLPTSPLPSEFFEGILANHGAKYFDIVSFHTYASWTEEVGVSVEESYADWAHRGGMIEGKVSYLREAMDRYELLYGYPIDKPIIQTEAALNCYPYPVPEGFPLYCDDPVRVPKFHEAQSEYVIGLFVRNLARGLLGTIWYTVEGPGWRNSSLLFNDGTPKPVYHALYFLRNELRDAQFSSQLTIGSYDPKELKAYEFKSAAKRIWVLWVGDLCMEDIVAPINPYQTCEIDPEVEPPTITLPVGWIRVLDKYGSVIQPVNGTITLINTSPIYIELAP